MNRKRRAKTTAKRPTHDRAVFEAKNRSQFEKALASHEVVVADFWAPWCAPCKAMGPVFASVAREVGAELGDRVRFIKVNTEQNPRVAQLLEVNSIPSIIIFADGEVADAHVGMVSASRLRTMVERALKQRDKVGLVDRFKRLFVGGEAAA